MSTADKKALVIHFLDEVYNKRNYSVADQLIAPNYTSHNELDIQVLGPEGIKRAAQMQHNAFPDLVSEFEDVIAEGNKVVVRGVDRATHLGEFMGFPPTGKPITLTWIDIFRLENGQLVEAWLETNTESLKRQLSGGND